MKIPFIFLLLAQGLESKFLSRIGPVIPTSEIELLKPSFAECWNKYGAVKLQEGSFNEALSHFSAAIDYDPDLSGAYYNKGCALLGLGHYSSATISFHEMIRLNPENIDAHIALSISTIFSDSNYITSYHTALEDILADVGGNYPEYRSLKILAFAGKTGNKFSPKEWSGFTKMWQKTFAEEDREGQNACAIILDIDVENIESGILPLNNAENNRLLGRELDGDSQYNL